LRHAWQLYRHGVVAGSKARIAGYSSVQAYTSAAWAYYRHIEEWVIGGRKVGVGKKEKGVGEKRGNRGSVGKPR